MSSIDYLIEGIGSLPMFCFFCFESLAMLVILIHHCPAMFHLHLLDIGLQLLDFEKIIKDIENKNWVDIEYAYYEYLCSLLKNLIFPMKKTPRKRFPRK